MTSPAETKMLTGIQSLPEEPLFVKKSVVCAVVEAP